MGYAAGVEPPSHPYWQVLVRLLSAPNAAWLEGLLRAPDPQALKLGYARIGRRLGNQPVELLALETQAISQRGLPQPQGWPLSSLARSLLLQLAFAGLAASERQRLARELFRTGDNAEREALLRTLDALPQAAAHLELAVEACRSHVQSVFEAIACENPYPARHFPEPNFNQMVMKAFFTSVPVRRIVHLGSRLNDELARMALDFASERRAAGRPVPDDLALVSARSPSSSS